METDPLAPDHRKALEQESAIPPHIIEARGYLRAGHVMIQAAANDQCKAFP